MDIANGTAKGTLNTNDDLSDLETSTIDFSSPDTIVHQRLDGRFFIERNLAHSGSDEGGIGLVYLALDEKLGRKVVVKILQESAQKNDYIHLKFLQEREALTRFNHHGIVKILDHGKLTDGNPFMVIEFIDGRSLRKVLQAEGKLSLRSAAHLIESLTDALAHAHSKGVIHRDIKPENIMLTAQDDTFDHMTLIDFGIARVGGSKVADPTFFANVVGTIKYMSPEQHFADTDLTAASDIYSAAIVAYEILTGQLPFQPQTPTESNEKLNSDMFRMKQLGVRTRPRFVRNDIPVAAEKILLSALEFEKGKRPQNARAFGRELGEALRGNAPAKPRKLLKALLIGLIGIFSALAIFLWSYTYLLIKDTPEDPGNKEAAIVIEQDSPVIRNETVLPDRFNRTYIGHVEKDKGTMPLTMQLERQQTMLRGTAITSASDLVTGTITDAGDFVVGSTPVGKNDVTGTWKGRIGLDGTITGEYTLSTSNKTRKFSLKEVVPKNPDAALK